MKKEGKHKNSLSITKGVEQPPSVNPDSLRIVQTRSRDKIPVSQYRESILKGNISILGQAITLIESSLPEHKDIAMDLVEECLPYSGNSVRIGITGVPGVGKSYFIESFGKILTGEGSRVAVLAVDPSSERSRGSILGDKTRMDELSADPYAFIRPSPSGGSLGGVSDKTRESIILCEAAGFDTIIVETVGVGQSETAVHSMVDFFLLLILAGAGDELQGIKRGIMEMADAIAITKSDGSNIVKADFAKAQYQEALKLFPPKTSRWVPRVLTCSSITGEGFNKFNDTLKEYFDYARSSGFFSQNRSDQSLYWMRENIERQLKEDFYKNPLINSELDKLRQNVIEGKISSFRAAKKILDKYF